MEVIELYNGDGSELILIRPDIADDAEVISNDWLCQTWVTDKYGKEVIAPRVETNKTTDNLKYIISLSPDDTALLALNGAVTEYVWVVEIINDALVPPFQREKHITVLLKA